MRAVGLGDDLTAFVGLKHGPTQDAQGEVYSGDIVVTLFAHTEEIYNLMHEQLGETQEVFEALMPDIEAELNEDSEFPITNARVVMTIAKEYYEDNPR